MTSKNSKDNSSIYIDPTTDAGFKLLFGNENYQDVLAFFLNSVLEKEIGDPIVELKHLDKEILGDDPDSRKAIFDIYCETACGKRIIVEMQHAEQEFFVKRSMFYNSRAVSVQGVKGIWDFDFLPVYGVFILNFTLPELGDDWLVDGVVWNKNLNQQLTDSVCWKYIQLPNFHIHDSDLCDTNVQRLTYLIKNMGTMTSLMPFTSLHKEFERLERLCRLSSLSPDDRMQYERELKHYRDIYNQIAYAQKKGLREGMEIGIQKGIQKGIEEGIEKGLEKGLEKGIEKGLSQAVGAFAATGMPISQIASVLKISEEEAQRMADGAIS